LSEGLVRLTTSWLDLALWVGPRGIRRLAWPAPPEAKPGSGLEPLEAFFEGLGPFPGELALDLEGLSPFQRGVAEALRRTRPGETITYGALAAALGHPRAARAVAQALKRNPIPILIPCHRVVGSGWSGGFSFPGGLDVKARLLALERAILDRP